jgi:hypothetical protein
MQYLLLPFTQVYTSSGLDWTLSHNRTTQVQILDFNTSNIYCEPDETKCNISKILNYGNEVEMLRLYFICLWEIRSSSKGNMDYLGEFEVFTAVTMKNVVFWEVILCDSCKN